MLSQFLFADDTALVTDKEVKLLENMVKNKEMKCTKEDRWKNDEVLKEVESIPAKTESDVSG